MLNLTVDWKVKGAVPSPSYEWLAHDRGNRRERRHQRRHHPVLRAGRPLAQAGEDAGRISSVSSRRRAPADGDPQRTDVRILAARDRRENPNVCALRIT